MEIPIDGGRSTTAQPRPADEGVPAVRFSVSQVEFESGLAVAPPSGGLLAIVGGNNTGKSATLRRITSACSGMTNVPTAKSPVRKVDINKEGRVTELTTWLEKHEVKTSLDHGSTGVFSLGTPGEIHLNALSHYWGGESGLGPLFSRFVLNAEAENRFNGVSPAMSRGTGSEAPSHPFHAFQDSADLLKRVSDISEKFFNAPLALDTTGHYFSMRLGAPAGQPPRVTESQHDWANALAKLPALHEQGDGMRAFFSLVFPLMTGRSQVIIVDEPEAFLHPPQARGLGELLGNLALERGAQVIIATHSEDIVLGALASSAQLTVVRLTRENDGPSAPHFLPPSVLDEIRNDPISRNLRVLESLFHRAVVVVEGDQDAIFYKNALEGYLERYSEDPRWASEIMFIPAHGKQAIPKTVNLIQKLGTPVVAVADLDVLRTEAEFRKLMEAHCINWEEIEPIYKRAVRQHAQPVKAVPAEQALIHVKGILNSVEFVDREIAKRINSALKPDDPWSQVKSGGKAVFSGDSAQALGELTALCERAGVVLVEVGELERFCAEAPKGPSWISEALSRNAHEKSIAMDFAGHLLASLKAARSGEHGAPAPRAAGTTSEASRLDPL